MPDTRDEIRGETPEPSPQPSPTLQATLAHDEDADETMDETLAPKKAPKRKRSVSEVADDDEVPESAQPKRRKESRDQPAKATPPHHNAPAKPNDKGKGKEVENESAVKNQAGDLGAEPSGDNEVQKDVEMAEIVKDESDYISDAYLAQLGLINNYRIAQLDENFSQITYTRIDYHEDKGVKQTEKQAQFESFFMEMDPNNGELTSTIARLRVEFVKPYDDIDDKLGEWSRLSLIMRLNLIESLQQVEKAGEIKFDEDIDRRYGDGEEAREQKWWIETKDSARRIRISCERSQILCKDPKNWSKYKPHGLRRGGEDGTRHGKGKGKTTGKPRAPPGTQETGTTPFTTPAAKKVSLWENLDFPPEKEEEFKMLLALDGIEDIDPTRQPESKVREHYAGEEYRFFFRWMEAKDNGGKTKWAEGTPACDQLERAHKHFFTNYPFEDKTQSKTRKGRAILRALTAKNLTNAAVKDKFAKFFPEDTKMKGVVKKEAEHVEEETAKESGGMEMIEAAGLQEEDPGHVSDEEQLPDVDAEGGDDSEGGGEEGSVSGYLDNPDED